MPASGVAWLFWQPLQPPNWRRRDIVFSRGRLAQLVLAVSSLLSSHCIVQRLVKILFTFYLKLSVPQNCVQCVPPPAYLTSEAVFLHRTQPAWTGNRLFTSLQGGSYRLGIVFHAGDTPLYRKGFRFCCVCCKKCCDVWRRIFRLKCQNNICSMGWLRVETNRADPEPKSNRMAWLRGNIMYSIW